ncbi:MAG: DMT family transporter [Devosia sp.]|jgi:transporter family-2 protein|nr:DMT family transporter [Alphaproteobacteria bacterium]MBU1560071.1 DMT family transporter [Alphaproteobacteria bacterium]MBU2301248.1 DMT family transporter [Alphaproteobacteria bacterium]MBU2366657.1 DMT family transporter [Alphaproteobacteria bacterium]
MTLAITYALLAGLLVGLSRQLNGRLALSTTPLVASFWNHIIGFAILTLLGLLVGGLVPAGAADAPWHAYVGGPIGVVFVAAGSWLIARIGAVNTALLVIGGQMVSGVALDLIRAVPTTLWASALGVVLILAGMALTQRR